MTTTIAPGHVYWITGLAGAGKTTIGRLLHTHLQSIGQASVYLDGDVLREVFGHTQSHSLEQRRQLASQYGKMCHMLATQGIDVVCATISMFDDVRAWNRQEIRHYHEIYLKVPIDVLVQRDQKALYSRAIAGQVSNVMGIDIPVEEPKCPDLELLNDGALSPLQIVQHIVDHFHLEEKS
ncbi:MAG: adenylyl-sulfate kinase [Gammaproteobacteria bacterium]|nr:adenylyl-sulfate kinase [Gammaproteobacteria bacterium]